MAERDQPTKSDIFYVRVARGAREIIKDFARLGPRVGRLCIPGHGVASGE